MFSNIRNCTIIPPPLYTMSGVAMVSMVTVLSLLASLPGLLAVPMLLGAPEAVEVDQTVVDFAMSQLSYGDCQKNNVRVENFKKQASSKTINIINLILNLVPGCVWSSLQL